MDENHFAPPKEPWETITFVGMYQGNRCRISSIQMEVNTHSTPQREAPKATGRGAGPGLQTSSSDGREKNFHSFPTTARPCNGGRGFHRFFRPQLGREGARRLGTRSKASKAKSLKAEAPRGRRPPAPRPSRSPGGRPCGWRLDWRQACGVEGGPEG